MNINSITAAQQEASLSTFSSTLLAWCLICALAALAIFELKAPKALPMASPQSDFSAERALAHIRAIARVPHTIGSTPNAEASEYLTAQLSALGMNPQVTTAVGIHNGSRVLIAGKTRNIIARLSGTANSRAVMLVAHYDSVASGPGAADDAAGVAAILEAVRALARGPQLRNDLIVLVTDGEEAGLLGAEAFVASHPWMNDVGLVMNFEARGNRGPSLLFETSANNASLIKEFARAAPYPTGSSLFYAFYKLLPNDTDFTVFRLAGTPGLNFAFGGRLEAYHSWLDTADNLDPASLQHHGSYVLSLARHFGQMDLSKLRQETGDEVFFDWFSSNLIVYSESWVMIGGILVSVLLALAIVRSILRVEVRAGRLVLAVLPSFAILLVIPVVMIAAGWLLLQFLGGRQLWGDTSANSFLLIGLTVLGAAVGSAVLAKCRRYFNLQELSLAGLAIVCILNWLVVLLLPAGSYMLFWPLLLTTAGLVVLGLAGKMSPRSRLVGTLIGAITTILIFSPIAYLLYVFLTLNLLSIAAVGLLLGTFFIICIPLVDVAVPQRPWRAVVLPLLAGAGTCLAIGIVQSHSSAQHPRHDTILYSVNADDHTAAWISYDNTLDEYTSQLIPRSTLKRQPAPNYLAGSQQQVFSGPAPVVDLQPPVSEIKADEQTGDLHNIRMNVRSQRDANLMLIRFDPSVQPVSVKISGRNMNPNQKPAGLSMLLYGMGAQGADLELTINAPSGVSFWISDYSPGLPTTQRRTAGFIAQQGSDQTLVSRKYTLRRVAE
ncbi:MAG TPA: M20/M25/M40 family metallo-hydrolase [Candidatus Saccharimonadales bacterium]|jgi:hypothetical protein|nr:M20/M25/M40 family metallo-hydrolase [Candidatus Saccharimonadales bacterium]